ncbi:MAG TPA: nitroreductase family protein [Dehalococcoidia bacterium]|nr:nitroreductase family protein [Dehalococcoidia bacterium]
MDTYRTIISKRDTRAFLDQRVPEETVRRIVQAGRMAGSSKNTQPCRFIVIDDPKVRDEFAKCGDFATWIPGAPLVIAVAALGGTRPEFDAGRAAQNMMIAAWAEEIGSCPISLHHQECARETLGLPEDASVPVAVGFGYRSKPPKTVPEAARLGWDEYVHRNRW